VFSSDSPLDKDISLPFPFFVDLYKEQRKIVETLATKVNEVERIA